MKKITTAKILALICLTSLQTGCGVSTRVSGVKNNDVMNISVHQKYWGLSLRTVGEFNLEFEFNDFASTFEVIPAPELSFMKDDEIPTSERYDVLNSIWSDVPHEGFIEFNQKSNKLEIRLYQMATNLNSLTVCRKHPLNGVYKVNVKNKKE